jgi:hypothetical protein
MSENANIVAHSEGNVEPSAEYWVAGIPSLGARPPNRWTPARLSMWMDERDLIDLYPSRQRTRNSAIILECEHVSLEGIESVAITLY